MPPDRRGGPEAPPTGPTANTTSHPLQVTGTCHFNGNRRRYTASRRMPPIGPCWCIRDPLADRHQFGSGDPSQRMVDAAVAAAHHILDAGYLPIFDVPTLRAMWHCGHHRLVDELGGAR